MKIILLQEIDTLGKAGEVKEVKDGYARNYLLPRGLAMEATSRAMKELEARRDALLRREKEELDKMKGLADKLAGYKILIKARAGDTGKLFGSVTSKDIVDQLKKEGYNIDRRKIELSEPIRSLGTYQAGIKLYPDISVEIEVRVEDIQERGNTGVFSQQA